MGCWCPVSVCVWETQGASLRGPIGLVGVVADVYALRVNLPRSVFTKRESAPLDSSRNMALYNVAAGVLPPGEDQYFFAAIASIISGQVIGSPASAKTRAAPSRALSFFSPPAFGLFAFGLFAEAG